MKVFHGTTLIVDTPLVGVGRKNLDFGEGFYLTSIRQQAIEWAQRPINKEKPQYLNCYELDICEISKNNYRYLKFGSYDDAWLDFVIGNRHGEMLWECYDLVEGGIANDRVFNTIELYDDEGRPYTKELPHKDSAPVEITFRAPYGRIWQDAANIPDSATAGQPLVLSMQYPEDALAERAEGIVQVSFVVEKDGSTSEFEVLDEHHPALEAEAVRILQQMPKWTPATQDGVKVRVEYTVPVKFIAPEQAKEDDNVNANDNPVQD